MKKTISALILVGVLGLITACSSVSTEPDQIGLHYDSGPLSDTKFQNCVKPGTQNFDGPDDTHYVYPAGQRNFDFTGSKTADSAAVGVVSKDNVSLSVTGIATFSLNTNCDILQQFHERIGLKYKAYMNGENVSPGWKTMLNAYIRQPLEKALDAVSKQYGYKDLYTNPKVKEEWENKVSELSGQFIKDLAGDDYFCNPDYVGKGSCGFISLTLQSPTPPANIVAALQGEQQAVAENNAQKEKNVTAQTELQQIQKIVNVLGRDGYIEDARTKAIQRAIDSGKVQIIPVPWGTDITVQPPK